MNKTHARYATAGLFAIMITISASAQKKKFDRVDFTPVATKPVPFTPFKKTDFAPAGVSDDVTITLPNKKKVKLSDYINTLNQIESNLSAIGFAKDRKQNSIVASKYKGAGTLTVTNSNMQLVRTAAMVPMTKAPAMTARFVNNDNRLSRAKELSKTLNPANAERINSLPNEKFDRTVDLTPPVFRSGDYGVTIIGKYYLKGENDPFVFSSNDLTPVGLTRVMGGTTSFYTAGLNITAASTLPELGGLTAFKLETEFTARSSREQKHSSKAKLQIMQQVLLNENRTAVAEDSYSFNENRIYQANKLIGSADIFTYGINLLLPVDFYLTAVGIGANIDVDLKKTGITGSIGPRVSQSIILETSASELAGAIGEGIGNTVDVGVGGELRLIEGGFDFGFTAGLAANNNRLVFVNDMYGEADVSLLLGRLFTYYQYPVYKCDNIQGLTDLACWEIRRVETDLFNTGAAIKFEKKVIDDDNSVYVNW